MAGNDAGNTAGNASVAWLDMANMRKTTMLGAVLLTTTAGVAVGPAIATADPDPAAGDHTVTYTITTTSDLHGDIRYIQTDPPSRAAYDADADKYLTTLYRTQITAGQPLVYTTTLADPGKWAFVNASGGLRVNPEFHCEIAVDGEVVVSQQCGSGVTCSTQPW